MQINLNNMIPGLLTKGVEFFAVGKNKVEAFHDRKVLAFHELPDFAYEALKKFMGNPDATMEEMEAVAFKYFGGMDDTVDICACGKIGQFEYLTDHAPAMYDDGSKISDAQLQVLKLIHLDNKSIADKLFISPYTVARHCETMFSKSGLKSRTQLALWAKKKGIIN